MAYTIREGRNSAAEVESSGWNHSALSFYDAAFKSRWGHLTSTTFKSVAALNISTCSILNVVFRVSA